MVIEYTKSYNEKEFNHFKLYDDLKFNDTNIFYEYEGLIRRNKNLNKEELLKVVNEYVPKAKSKLRYSLERDTLSFYPSNKYIFPKFYLIFK